MTTAADIMDDVSNEDSTDSLLRGLVLRDVQLIKWSGEIVQEKPLAEVRLAPATAGYLVDDDRVACRFDQQIDLLSADGETTTTIAAGVVVDFHRFEQVEFTASDENVLGELLVPAAWSVAWPYVREAVQTMTLRLGLDPVTLGILNRRDLSPQDVHVRGIAEFRERS